MDANSSESQLEDETEGQARGSPFVPQLRTDDSSNILVRDPASNNGSDGFVLTLVQGQRIASPESLYPSYAVLQRDSERLRVYKVWYLTTVHFSG